MAKDPVKPTALRCFLALPLYPLFSEELDPLLTHLRRKSSGVRWAEPRQVHLTLHFFGDIPESEIDHIDLSMRRVAQLFAPIRLTLGCVGGFPNLERPNILWLSVEDKGGSLSLFQRAVCAAVSEAGFKIEERPFRPHATIGRVKGRMGDLKRIVSGIPFRFPTAAKAADHFVLYQSRCLQGGARHEILKTYALTKKA